MGALTKDSLNEVINALNIKVKDPIDHYVLNHSCSQEIVTSAISKLPIKVDVRPIYNPNGNPNKWMLEAVGKTKSLATVGEKPSS